MNVGRLHERSTLDNAYDARGVTDGMASMTARGVCTNSRAEQSYIALMPCPADMPLI